MARDDVILRFDTVSFEFAHDKPLLDEVSFSVRAHSRTCRFFCAVMAARVVPQLVTPITAILSMA